MAFRALIGAIALSLIGCQLPTTRLAQPQGAFSAGELLVQFKPNAPQDAIQAVNKAVGATPIAQLNDQGLWQVSVEPGHEREAMNRYQGQGWVAYAEANRSLSTQMVGGFRFLNQRSVLASNPNDAYYPAAAPLQPGGPSRQGLPGQEWAFQTMKVLDAWDRTTGSSKITVAVLDTGVDAGHEDLQTCLVAGHNFVDAQAANAPDDDYGHGTHIAGIIAATANNNVGIAGVAPGCKVMPIRVLGVEGGSTAALIQGLEWARTHGAKVVNMSLGSNQYSKAEEDEIKRVIGDGITVVAAAGNEALTGNPLSYPGSIDGVVSVGAVRPGVDANNNPAVVRADFSNFNPFVTVAAPGVDILSTVPRRFQSPGNPAYAYASGTSMASPMVAGVVALMLSANPKLTPADVVAKLRRTAYDLAPAGIDPYFGSGLVQAGAAVQ